jgi:GNAT superfamily N-acetyltransferase
VIVTTRPLVPEDADACDAIMRGLPDFFSHEGGLAACREAVRSQAGYVAEDDGVIGFATWEPRTTAAAEITWMAVKRSQRHAGIGTAIIEALVADLQARGYRLALAMTSARPKQPDVADTYEPTRRFWEARAFLPLIELDIWETNVALLQVRAIGRS